MGMQVQPYEGVVIVVGIVLVVVGVVVVGLVVGIGIEGGKVMGLTLVTAALKTRTPMSYFCKRFLVFSLLLVKSNQLLFTTTYGMTDEFLHFSGYSTGSCRIVL